MRMNQVVLKHNAGPATNLNPGRSANADRTTSVTEEQGAVARHANNPWAKEGKLTKFPAKIGYKAHAQHTDSRRRKQGQPL